MAKKPRSRLWHLTNASLRLAILRGATRPFAQNLIVNEYPKSGASWLSGMLSEALDLPFPRHRFPMVRSCLMQCHVLGPQGMRNVVVVWRDGRDVAVSYYHHLLIGHENAKPEWAERTAQKLGISEPADVAANLPRFIEALMKNEIGPGFTWVEFANVWHNRPGVVETRYEDLLRAPVEELRRIVGQVDPDRPFDVQTAAGIVENHSFQKQTGRQNGEEATGQFQRKGIAGDWRNYFTPEADQIFMSYCKDAMYRLGYFGESAGKAAPRAEKTLATPSANK